MVKDDFGVSAFAADALSTVTQVGYAAGLFFLVPLGDMVQRRKIIMVNCAALVASLLVTAVAPRFVVVAVFSFIIGAASVMPQILLPIASQFSEPANKERNTGIVLSGILVGVLGARVLSGLVGHALGWRSIFYFAAAFMLVSGVIVLCIVPTMPANFRGGYGGLMKSIAVLAKEHPLVIAFSCRGGLCFASMLALWSTLAFKLARPPFNAGSNVVGLLALVGVGGAVASSFLGKPIHRYGAHVFNLLGSGLHLLAWAVALAFQNHYAGIIAAIVFLDIGMQCVQLSNQTSIFAIDPKASSRLNTIYMTLYFFIGALGTLLAGWFWSRFAWTGVVCVGAVLSAGALAITLISRR
jgi:predicted MFS family arabinose efflux permease